MILQLADSHSPFDWKSLARWVGALRAFSIVLVLGLVCSPVSMAMADEATRSITLQEWDWPESPWVWGALALGVVLASTYVVQLYRRDTAEISPAWGWCLATLRLLVLAGLVLIAANPHQRTQRSAYRPSRLALLVDTSLSMRHADRDGALPGDETPSRAASVRALLAESPVIQQLQRQHELTLFTFDERLSAARQTWPWTGATETAEPPIETGAAAGPDWQTLLEPNGLESRLGEALLDVQQQLLGAPLGGLIVLTDGVSNSGLDPRSALERLEAARLKIAAVGLGGAEAPLNVQLAEVQAPTDVQRGDRFSMTAFWQVQGRLSGDLLVELLKQPEDASQPPIVVEQKTAAVAPEVTVGEVTFTVVPTEAGVTRYVVRVTPPSGSRELTVDDNRQTLSVNVLDRPMKVLLLAGGPMRDYQFVRNLLHRHRGFAIDVLLQTASVGTSQESNQLLTTFPLTPAELYQYDAVVAFDPNWRSIPTEGLQLLSEWVYQEAGGLVMVAGDVFTPQLFSTGEGGAVDPYFAPLRELLPVVLSSQFIDYRVDVQSPRPWPLRLSADARSASFLQITDDSETSLARWGEFAGFCRTYPLQGLKAGATVYAELTDPLVEKPVAMASQFFGQGRVFYLGSAEMWRLRAVSDEDYDRFWTKLLREMSQGRLRRGAKRGVLLPESRKSTLGQTLRLRARVLDPQYRPWTASQISLDVFDPAGKVLDPPVVLAADPNRPGEFTGALRAAQAGEYRLELPLPDSRERVTEEITVLLPRLEDENIRQNVTLLQELARPSGGAYLTLANAAEELPKLFPAKGETIQVDERIQTLWDREWVLYVLATLLGVEWTLRKLLRLA